MGRRLVIAGTLTAIAGVCAWGLGESLTMRAAGQVGVLLGIVVFVAGRLLEPG